MTGSPAQQPLGTNVLRPDVIFTIAGRTTVPPGVFDSVPIAPPFSASGIGAGALGERKATAYAVPRVLSFLWTPLRVSRNVVPVASAESFLRRSHETKPDGLPSR